MPRRESPSSAAVLAICRLLQSSWVVAGLAVAVLSGCGPAAYVNQVTRKASSEVDAAKSVQADKHAPYYYTLAIEYLHKAREEAAAADFQAANRFGRRSESAARKARTLAIERARDPEKRPKITPLEEVGSAEDEDLDPRSKRARADESDNPLKNPDQRNSDTDTDIDIIDTDADESSEDAE